MKSDPYSILLRCHHCSYNQTFYSDEGYKCDSCRRYQPITFIRKAQLEKEGEGETEGAKKSGPKPALGTYYHIYDGSKHNYETVIIGVAKHSQSFYQELVKSYKRERGTTSIYLDWSDSMPSPY